VRNDTGEWPFPVLKWCLRLELCKMIETNLFRIVSPKMAYQTSADMQCKRG